MALKGGKGSAPLWASVLVAAEAWGTPPWMIVDHPGSARWLGRFHELRRLRAFVERPQQAREDDDGEG